MKRFVYYVGLMITFLVVSCARPVLAQEDTFRQIESAIQMGDVKTLAGLVKGNADITIGEEEGTYSVTQAEFILKSFFEKNAPKNFRFNHKGTSNNMFYAIGVYNSANGDMRVYALLKQEAGKNYIQELRFEK